MKKQMDKTAAALALIFGHLALVGACAWKATKPAKPKREREENAVEGESREAIDEDDQEMESLSLNTPGEAPLDRLARRGAAEEREEARIEAIGSSGELTRAKPASFPQPWTHNSPIVAELLRHQSLEIEKLQGWSTPMPERLPVPTFAPAVMALGIVIFVMGLATIWYVSVVGAIVFAIAAWRWTGELQGG